MSKLKLFIIFSFFLSLGSFASVIGEIEQSGDTCPDESYFSKNPMNYAVNIYGYIVSYKRSDTKDPICLAHRQQDGSEFLLEMLPRNQSLSNWNEMFTIQALIGSKDKDLSNENLLESLDSSTFCAGNYSIKTISNNNEGIEAVKVCGSYSDKRLTNDKNMSEVTQYLIRRAGGNLYIFYCSKRGKPFNASQYNFNNREIKKQSKFLNSIKIEKAE